MYYNSKLISVTQRQNSGGATCPDFSSELERDLTHNKVN